VVRVHQGVPGMSLIWCNVLRLIFPENAWWEDHGKLHVRARVINVINDDAETVPLAEFAQGGKLPWKENWRPLALPERDYRPLAGAVRRERCENRRR
jgi:hypothetical protein